MSAMNFVLSQLGGLNVNIISKDQLTQKRLTEVLDYNFITGRFIRKAKGFGRRGSVGAVAGYRDKRKNTIHIKVDGITYAAHRLAFLYMTGSFPVNQIDHVNGEGTCNSWHNLVEHTK